MTHRTRTGTGTGTGTGTLPALADHPGDAAAIVDPLRDNPPVARALDNDDPHADETPAPQATASALR